MADDSPQMATIAIRSDSDEIELVPPQTPDRLPAMLFLAALVHGILIIGVTFNPYLLDDLSDAISLEVTMVADPDQRIDRPDEAEYLAQASQQGGGNTADEVRPSAPLQSASPIDNLGEENAEALLEATSHEKSADQLVTTQGEQDLRVADDLREEPRPEDSTAIALERGSEQTLPLPQDAESTLLIHDDDPRQLIISADTRESTTDLTGSPTLEVSIEASGQLAEVVIRQSSGSTVLDKAALDILRRASPFDPFPPEIRSDYDRLRFAYKWVFNEQLEGTTASTN
jgi:protein TonB